MNDSSSELLAEAERQLATIAGRDNALKRISRGGDPWRTWLEERVSEREGVDLADIALPRQEVSDTPVEVIYLERYRR